MAPATQEMAKPISPVSPYETRYSNLTKDGRILFATDEWFAAADRMLDGGPPIWDPESFCEQGKVMDGWESRRRREAGHDWCVVRLGFRSQIAGIEIDTAHFSGNQVPAVSLLLTDIQDANLETKWVAEFPGIWDRLLHGGVRGTGASPEQVHQAEEICRTVEWKEILPRTSLFPGYEASRMHYFDVNPTVVGTHLRVNCFPDGGIARLRLWGHPLEAVTLKPGPLYSPIQTGRICTVVPHNHERLADAPSQKDYAFPELSAAINGGTPVACSNQHYGGPSHLIQSGFAKDMGDGWETARHPSRPGIVVKDNSTGLSSSSLSDWCILKLGSVAKVGISRIILDTMHFKGNYPESVQVEGCLVQEGQSRDSLTNDWFPLIQRCRMAPNSEHVFNSDQGQILNPNYPVSHVRITIFPDGGLARVHIYGALT